MIRKTNYCFLKNRACFSGVFIDPSRNRSEAEGLKTNNSQAFGVIMSLLPKLLVEIAVQLLKTAM